MVRSCCFPVLLSIQLFILIYGYPASAIEQSSQYYSIHDNVVTINWEQDTGTPKSKSLTGFLNINNIDDPLINVPDETTPTGDGNCGAYVAPGVWKEFDCYNLAAIGKETGADPFIPSWELIGGYWQWGRKGPDPGQWYNTNTPHFAHGPTGPGEGDANAVNPNGWDVNEATDGAWSDSRKTDQDPCPTGYRVPTGSQWEGIQENNSRRIVGTWSNSVTNYSSALFLGDGLMLPTAGYRDYHSSSLSNRGHRGYYWSSTVSTIKRALSLSFGNRHVHTPPGASRLGLSIRCIAEDQPPLPVVLSKTRVTLESGESETITISGGTGYYTVETGNGNVATVTPGTGDIFTIQGVSPGTTAIIVTDSSGSTAELSVTVLSSVPLSLDIRVEGSDGPVTVSQGVPVSMAVTLDPGRYAGFDADWWFACLDSSGNWHSLVSDPFIFEDRENWIDGLERSFSAPLKPLWSIEISVPDLPVGQNFVVLALDDNDDGKLDATWLDYVEINVKPDITDNGEAVNCGAYVAPGVWKEFDCYNLAAIGKTTGDDPFTPSWRLIGGYWQWGRKGADPNRWYDTNTSNFVHGPTGPDSSEANDGSISGWDSIYAPNGAWSDSYKTANDPCPDGFRVPTRTQWQGVVDNNTQSTVGSWSFSDSDYSSAWFFGNNLMLPAAGYRGSYSGALHYRGLSGYYWSSSEYYSNFAWHLYFLSGFADTSYGGYRRDGLSVRCVPE